MMIAVIDTDKQRLIALHRLADAEELVLDLTGNPHCRAIVVRDLDELYGALYTDVPFH